MTTKSRILIEGWRNFISEGEYAKSLRILDFDDTIADTGEKVKLYTDDGKSHRMIDSAEFAVHDLQPGEFYDIETSFEEFNDVNLDKALEIPEVSDILKRFINAPGARKILILTARNQLAEEGIRNFLRSIGIDDSNIDVVGVGEKHPHAKVREIAKYLDMLDGVEEVSFFDDSLPNTQAVAEYLNDRGIKYDVAHVKKDAAGEINLKRIKEALLWEHIRRKYLYS